MLSTVLKDVFTDVNIYDNDIRLLQYPFISPISVSYTHLDLYKRQVAFISVIVISILHFCCKSTHSFWDILYFTGIYPQFFIIFCPWGDRI